MEKFTPFFGGHVELVHNQDDVIVAVTGDNIAGICSQWLPCRFEVDGVTYNCTEQYMMAEKARLFGDEDAAQQIMKADNPRDQKALGRMVRNFDADTWNAVARDIVYRGNYAKFTQNPGLKDALLSLEGTLVEASPWDRIWGIGLKEHHPGVHNRALWDGTNWLGEVCTKVREDIRAGVETTEDFGWSQ